MLPPLDKVQTVAERMRSVSDTVVLSANQLGEFRLRAEGDQASVETEWRGLKHPEIGALTSPVLSNTLYTQLKERETRE